MPWTKKSYEALYSWTDVSKRPAVLRILKADGLDDVIGRLNHAETMGVWYRITNEAAEAVGADVVAQSAREAESDLDALAAKLLGRKGGLVKSPSKTEAVRENGKKGGKFGHLGGAPCWTVRIGDKETRVRVPKTRKLTDDRKSWEEPLDSDKEIEDDAVALAIRKMFGAACFWFPSHEVPGTGQVFRQLRPTRTNSNPANSAVTGVVRLIIEK